MTALQHFAQVASIGIGATALMDLWLAFLQRAGVKTQGFALIGRWVGHLLHGRISHREIRHATPIAGELAWGWLTHYATGIAFAALLVAIQGFAWSLDPTLAPAIGFGLLTVLAPLCVMQPAMGAGFFASRTPAPWKNVVRSVANHTVFGAGLYLSASAIAAISRMA